MEIAQHQSQDVIVLQPLVSRVDASNAQILKSTLIDSINAGHTKFVVDLQQVGFMDSTGLAALLSALKSLGKNGKMALSGVSDRVRKLFAITRLDNGVFTMAQTADEAVQALRGAGTG